MWDLERKVDAANEEENNNMNGNASDDYDGMCGMSCGDSLYIRHLWTMSLFVKSILIMN